MSRKLSSIPRYQLFKSSTTTPAIFNSTHGMVGINRGSKVQRWIVGMITGSAPFLVILFCWMFVSLCINNLVRFYKYRRNRYRQNDIENIATKADV
jgi:hypothetical protein